MEFGEKLQQLRKSKGLTQEELAERLFVSRTAVSKWESGRGMPSVDSLKDIAAFFGITVDVLLSGEALLSLAGAEHKAKLRSTYQKGFGILDLMWCLFALLPLYPHQEQGQVFGVNLWQYTQCSSVVWWSYWVLLGVLTLLGIATLYCSYGKRQKHGTLCMASSLVLHGCFVLFLGLSRQPYGVALAFLLFLFKGLMAWRYFQNKK